MSSAKPHVLIFGGLNHSTPALVQYLVPPLPAEPLVASVRIFDKYQVIPATTYIGKPFKKLLEERSDIIEYRQANLTIPSVVESVLSEPPKAGGTFSQIYDFTGDTTWDRPSAIHITHSFKVSLSIAHTAIKTEQFQNGGLKAYVRIIHPYYDHGEKTYTEEDPSGWKPSGVRGVWWHESIRALGKIPDLPLVVLRVPYYYGPNVIQTEITTHILCGYVYKRLGEEMKFLWGAKLKRNTVHVRDVAGALWACASWISTITPAKAKEIGGVPIPPSDDKEVKEVPEAAQKSEGSIIVPLFQVADDSDTTQELLGSMIAKVFGIQFGFSNVLQNQVAKFKMNEVAEDINEHHMEGWTQILLESDPPVANTALTPYAHVHQLEKHGFGADGTRLKKIVGYQLTKPTFDEASIKEVIQSFRDEGTWPETALYQG